MANYELGPCQIKTSVASSMTDLGKTEGGVTLNISNTFQALHTDQDGETPVDEWITGTTVTVTGAIADINHSALAKVLNTSVQTSASKSRVDVKPNAGYSLMTNGTKIQLIPYESGSPTTSSNKIITIWKGGFRAALAMGYNRTDQRVINFEIGGYPSASQSSAIVTFGDTTI